MYSIRTVGEHSFSRWRTYPWTLSYRPTTRGMPRSLGLLWIRPPSPPTLYLGINKWWGQEDLPRLEGIHAGRAQQRHSIIGMELRGRDSIQNTPTMDLYVDAGTIGLIQTLRSWLRAGIIEDVDSILSDNWLHRDH